jgi:hypothetical protein
MVWKFTLHATSTPCTQLLGTRTGFRDKDNYILLEHIDTNKALAAVLRIQAHSGPAAGQLHALNILPETVTSTGGTHHASHPYAVDPTTASVIFPRARQISTTSPDSPFL